MWRRNITISANIQFETNWTTIPPLDPNSPPPHLGAFKWRCATHEMVMSHPRQSVCRLLRVARQRRPPWTCQNIVIDLRARKNITTHVRGGCSWCYGHTSPSYARVYLLTYEDEEEEAIQSHKFVHFINRQVAIIGDRYLGPIYAHWTRSLWAKRPNRVGGDAETSSFQLPPACFVCVIINRFHCSDRLIAT